MRTLIAYPSAHRLRDTRAILFQRVRSATRPVMVFAVDGIPFVRATRYWRHADIVPVLSEFPTTSSTCWLSSLTGLSPVNHGALGFAQRFGPDDRSTTQIFHRDAPAFAKADTLFDDVTMAGGRAICAKSDLNGLEGPWYEALTHGAEVWPTSPFYSGVVRPDASDILARINELVELTIDAGAGTMVWVFLDIDLHIHRFGYDSHVAEVMAGLDATFAHHRAHVDFIAYSDHGLVPTRNDTRLSDELSGFCKENGLEIGGAGRLRWIYAGEDNTIDEVRSRMLRIPFEGISVFERDQLFPEFRANPAFRHRVGLPPSGGPDQI